MSKSLVPDPSTLPALVPEELAERAAAAVREILAEGAAANTTRSYASALRYWAGWHRLRYGQPIALPVPEAAVVQFIVDHLARRGDDGGGRVWELPSAVDTQLQAAGLKQKPGPFKHATVVHRVAVLSKAHQLRKAANPCEAPAVRHLLARGRRAAVKRGERPRKKTAITRTELEAMLATCDDSLVGVRDRALLCFAFASGGRRRSEVAAADVADLRRLGPEAYVFHLGASKTDQDGTSVNADKPLLGPAAVALTAWLEASGVKSGALFRRLWGERVGPALSGAAVAGIVQRRAQAAGLTGDFAGHSLRSGFVTEGGRQGVALPALMAMTDHRAVASVIGYFQSGSADQNPAARLLDTGSTGSSGPRK